MCRKASYGDVAHLGDAVFPAVHDESGAVGGQDYLGVGIKVAYHLYQPFLPFEVEAGFGFVHEKDIRLAVFGERGEQNDEYLLFSARQLVGVERFAVLLEAQFVASSVYLLAGFGEEVVNEVQKACFGFGCGFGLFVGLGIAAREEVNHAVADVDLIVQIASLQEIKLPVEFGVDVLLRQLGPHFAGYEHTVEASDDVVADACCVGGDKVDPDTKRGPAAVYLARRRHSPQVMDHFVDDGAFSLAVLAAQHVDTGMEVPDDVFMAAPKAADFYSCDVICQFYHDVWLLCDVFPAIGRVA